MPVDGSLIIDEEPSQAQKDVFFFKHQNHTEALIFHINTFCRHHKIISESAYAAERAGHL